MTGSCLLGADPMTPNGPTDRMSVAVYGRHHDDAVFEDDNGPARIPGAEIARILTRNTKK